MWRNDKKTQYARLIRQLYSVFYRKTSGFFSDTHAFSKLQVWKAQRLCKLTPHINDCQTVKPFSFDWENNTQTLQPLFPLMTPTLHAAAQHFVSERKRSWPVHFSNGLTDGKSLRLVWLAIRWRSIRELGRGRRDVGSVRRRQGR